MTTETIRESLTSSVQTSESRRATFKPTLIVGLGGSGQQIVRRTKRLINTVFGDVPVIRYVAFDTDDMSRDDQWQPLTPGRERIQLTGFDAEEILRNIEEDVWAELRERLPTDVTTHLAFPGEVAMGARQRRIVGLMAMFARWTEYFDGLTHAIQDLTSADNITDTNAIRRDGYALRAEGADDGVPLAVQVFVVCSIAGGTGSAMFLDTAYLIRHLLSQRGISAEISGVFVLPPVLDKALGGNTTQRDRIRANGFAALRELNHFIMKPEWRFAYPTLGPIDISAKPFDFQYLVDLTNRSGVSLSEPEDIFELAAQVLYMHVNPAVARAAASSRGNVEVIGLRQSATTEHRQAFSSFAAASIEIPVKELEQYSGSRLGSEVISQTLLGKALRGDELRSLLEASLLQTRDADTPALTARSFSDVLSSELSPPWDPIGAMGDTADTTEALNVLAQQDAAISDALTSIGQALSSVQANLVEGGIRSLKALAAEVVVEHGVETAIAVLELLADPADLQDSFAAQIAALRADPAADDSRATYERQRRRVEGLQGFWRRTWPLRWMFGGDRQSHHKLAASLLEESAQAAQRHAVDERVASIFADLESQARRIRATLLDVRQVLMSAQVVLDQTANTAESQIGSRSGGGYVLRHQVHYPEMFEEFYRRNSDETKRDAVARRLLSQLGLSDTDFESSWNRLVQLGDEALTESLALRISEIAGTTFRDAARREDVLKALQREVDPLKSPLSRVREVVALAQPFWSYNEARATRQQETTAVLGVASADGDRLISELSSTFQLAETGVPWRLDTLRVEHGSPAYLVHGVVQWETLYDSFRAQRAGGHEDAIHIFKAPDEALEPLIPVEARPRGGPAAERTWALGVALGFIVEHHSAWYLDLEQTLQLAGDPSSFTLPGTMKLADGRASAMDAFLRDRRSVAKTDKRARHLIDNVLGVERAINELTSKSEELLNEWGSAGTPRKPQLELERQHVETELRQLQNRAGR